MGNAQRKTTRLYIPARNKDEVAKPKPALGHECDHKEQVAHAFNFGFGRYKKAMEDLSKV